MTKEILDESGTREIGGSTVTIKAEPLEFELDPHVLGAEPAQAIADSVSRGIRQTSERRGNRRKWNNTGHLASGITVEKTDDGYAILAPPDRLQDPALLEQLIADVPELESPVTPEVDRAIDASADLTIRKL
jgi:hypothetical protein